MNENYSKSEWKYKKRWLGGPIRDAVAAFPVVVLTGARQVGKSTLLRHEFGEFAYRSLDDPAIRVQAREDPASIWKGLDRVVIDEAQLEPAVFSAVKLAVDTSERARRFILSGSSNILLMEKVSESLAGRAAYFELGPMTWSEEAEAGPPERWEGLWDPDLELREQDAGTLDSTPFLLRGLMPPVMAFERTDQAVRWWDGYVRTYLERDLRALSQIESLVDFRRMMEALALRSANVLNQTELARACGMSQPTVHRYVKLLEVTHVVTRVRPFLSSRLKRVTKSPKVFFLDPALSAFLAGYHDASSILAARERGAFLEGLVYLHLKAAAGLSVPPARVLFWRTSTGAEVDFVVERGRRALAVEVKATTNPTLRDAKGLLRLQEAEPSVFRGVLLHGGSQVRWLHSKVVAVPWWWPWVGSSWQPRGTSPFL